MSAISWPRVIAVLALTAGCVSAPHRQIRAPDGPEPADATTPSQDGNETKEG